MTKNMKIAAIVSAAALLVVGASMTSFAATGWQEEDGTWKYYDKYGESVSNTWEKSGSNWFYLNDQGEMATDSLIEDDDNYYYVDANGAMVTNGWIQMDNSDDDDEDAPATVWYYFQNNGKAYKAGTGNTSFKTINGKKYAFDSDSKMLFGWVDTQYTRQTGDDAWKNGTYYLGDENDGAQQYNSWAHLHVVDTDNTDDEDQDYWFYFGSNGKKYFNNKEDGYYEKTINGAKYTFGKNGNMLYEFVASGTDSKPDYSAIASVVDADNKALVKYFRTAEEGARVTKGWFRVVPDKFFDSKDSEDNDDNARWFYADGTGKFYADAVKTVNGKKYCFDDQGEMVDGLRYLTFDDNGDLTAISDKIDDSDKLDAATSVDKLTYAWTSDTKSGVYLFGDEETDGSMKTGMQTVTVDGDSYSFNFKTSGAAKGQGIQGLKSSCFYVNGRKVKADSDNKYEIYTYDETTKAMTKENTKELWQNQTNRTDYYTGTGTNKTKKANGWGYTSTDAKTQDPEFAKDNYVVVSASGQYITSGTKKDGDDYRIVVKNKQVYGIYIEY